MYDPCCNSPFWSWISHSLFMYLRTHDEQQLLWRFWWEKIYTKNISWCGDIFCGTFFAYCGIVFFLILCLFTLQNWFRVPYKAQVSGAATTTDHYCGLRMSADFMKIRIPMLNFHRFRNCWPNTLLSHLPFGCEGGTQSSWATENARFSAMV